MGRRALFILGVILSVALVQASFAQTGSQGYFTLSNDTSDLVVVGFYTNDGTGWSDDWLEEDLLPGETIDAEFFADTGSCEQLFRVGWLAENGDELIDEPISIDICEASNVYIEDEGISFD